MKNNLLSILTGILSSVAIIFTGCSSKSDQAKSSLKETTFKVYGNCEMCKKTIEGSLKDMEGIGAANWDVEKKLITIAYDASEINEGDIHKRIAGVGYDTDKERGSDEAYQELPGCCQYERRK
jgi:periplasmic mercuric ion binding protein